MTTRGKRPKVLDASEFAELLDVSPTTVKTWARHGFPGAQQVMSEKNRPKWVFDSVIATRFAQDVARVNKTFRVIGR